MCAFFVFELVVTSELLLRFLVWVFLWLFAIVLLCDDLFVCCLPFFMARDVVCLFMLVCCAL